MPEPGEASVLATNAGAGGGQRVGDQMPVPGAREVSSAECIVDLDRRSSTFTALGTISRFHGRIGLFGYPPGGAGGRRVGELCRW